MKLTRTLLALIAATILLPCLPTSLEAARQAQRLKSVTGRTDRTLDNRRAAAARDSSNALENIDEKWYFEFTPALVRTSSEFNRFRGANAAIGWRITQEDKLQIELGYYISNNFSTPENTFAYRREDKRDVMTEQLSSVFTFDGTRYDLPVVGRYTLDMKGTRTAKGSMIPVLVSYSSVFKPFRNFFREKLELRLTPVIGCVIMNNTWTVNATGSYTEPALNTIFASVTPTDGLSVISEDGRTITRTESFRGRDSNYIAFTMGGGFAFTYYLSDRLYADVGYRYLWTAKAANKTDTTTFTGTPWNGMQSWNGMNTHFYTLTLGWKF